MPADSEGEERELAQQLFDLWDQGQGISKSELERRTWGDGSSHGRRFDRFVRRHLGVSTSKPSKQTDRISELELQVRSLGSHPVGTHPTDIEVQLQHSRAACLAALRIWNDPQASFRTGSFSLLFVAAWNSLALALLQTAGIEWRRLDAGKPVLREGLEVSLDTMDLVSRAFEGDDHRGLRENVRFWLDLRNCAAHRYLPVLDISVIPYAQAGLLNYERVLSDEFGDVYQLAEHLSVPLQLSGFRDPDVLTSRRRAQAALPLDVQALLSRAEAASPELLTDETFMMRVAFIPAVPASGRNPDAVAYFVRPGEVPTELSDMLSRYVVMPKTSRGPRPNIGAKRVTEEVQRRIPFKFNTGNHAAVARFFSVRPPKGEPDRTIDERFCEYVPAAKIYVYNQKWIDHVVELVSSADGFLEGTGRDPTVKGS